MLLRGHERNGTLDALHEAVDALLHERAAADGLDAGGPTCGARWPAPDASGAAQGIGLPRPATRRRSARRERRLLVGVRDVGQLAPHEGQGQPGPDEGEPPRRGDAPPVRDQPAQQRADRACRP